jgi:hypothetical protein
LKNVWMMARCECATVRCHVATEFVIMPVPKSLTYLHQSVPIFAGTERVQGSAVVEDSVG